jgi:hypothetical protein
MKLKKMMIRFDARLSEETALALIARVVDEGRLSCDNWSFTRLTVTRVLDRSMVHAYEGEVSILADRTSTGTDTFVIRGEASPESPASSA